MNYVILNGIDSRTIRGLLIQSLPPISKPLMRTEVEEIDGRDGDIITKLGYSAYDKQITVGLYGDFKIDEVIGFFNSEGTVTFSNEADKFYKYQIIAQIDFERLIRFRVATVTFHVQPFKYSLVDTAKTLVIDNDSLHIRNYSEAKNGVTIGVSNGVITVSGTSSSTTEFFVPVDRISLPIGNYILTAYAAGTGADHCTIRLINDSPSNINSFGGTYVTLEDGQDVMIETTSDSAQSYNYLYFFIEAGTIAITATVELTSGDYTVGVVNDGNYVSKPKLTIYGIDDVSVYLNDHLCFSIALGDDGYITIDTALMEASKDGALKNRSVSGDYDLFTMQVGLNLIKIIGTVEKIVIEDYSRWS